MKIQVLLDGGPVTLPWQSRQDLLAEFRHLDSRQALLDVFDSRQALLDAFEAVGTSRAVALTPEQKGESLEVIESWSARVPYQDLPEGILELRAALADDVDAVVAGLRALPPRHVTPERPNSPRKIEKSS